MHSVVGVVYQRKVSPGRAHFFCIVKVAKVNLCLSCCCYTVWKFHNFSVSHILREINLGDLEAGKVMFLLFYGL